MTALTPLQATKYRLAHYYCDKLQRASAAIRRGPGNREYWLRIIQHDWEQVKEQQSWSASGQGIDSDRARLCAAFAVATADIMRVQLTPSEQLAWVQQALAAARAIHDIESELNLLYQASFLGLTLETPDSAEDYGNQLFVRAQAAQNDLGLGRAQFILGATDFVRGDYDKAEEGLRRCIEPLRRCDAINEMGQAWLGLGRIANVRGDYQQARAYYLEYLNTAIATDHQQAELEARMSLSGAYLATNDLETAQTYAQEALKMARSLGITRFLPPALLSLAHVEKAQSRLDNACEHYEEAIKIARAMSAPSVIVNGLHGLGQARATQDDYTAALVHFEEALGIAREARYLLRLCEVAHDMVFVHVKEGDLEAAYDRLADALDSAKQLGTPYFMAKAVASAVVLWQSLGEYEQAAQWAGLLATDLSLLPPSLFDDAVYEQLEHNLGPERYHRALEQGGTLTLEDVTEEIANLLENAVHAMARHHNRTNFARR